MMSMLDEIFGGKLPPRVKVIDMTIDADGHRHFTSPSEGMDAEARARMEEGLPPGLADGLRDVISRMIGADAGPASDDHPLLKKMKKRPIFRTPTAAEMKIFLEGIETFNVGDIVTTRGAEFESFQWPEGVETAVISRILEPTFVGTEPVDKASPRDVTIMLMQNMDETLEAWRATTDGRPVQKPMYIEVPFDSRRLKKVGSIYD